MMTIFAYLGVLWTGVILAALIGFCLAWLRDRYLERPGAVVGIERDEREMVP